MKAYKKVVIFFIIQCIKVNVSILEEEKDTALTQEQQIANIPKTNGKTDQQYEDPPFQPYYAIFGGTKG